MSHKHPISRTPFYSLFISLVICAFLLASCGSPVAAVPTPVPASPTPTTALPSPMPQVITATPQPTPITPTDIPPTETPLMPEATPTILVPTASQVPAATPHSFMNFGSGSGTGTIALITGTTEGVVQGNVLPGQVLRYYMGAGQAQPLILLLDSPNNDVTLGVFEANNNVLLDPARKVRYWNTVLPSTEQYTIQVVGGATSEGFTLTVKLPLVVSFTSGSSSTTLNGSTVNGYPFSYSLNCAGGQTLNASLNVPATTATINIFGVSSGVVLVDPSAGFASWSGVLPQTQDYVVEVVPYNYPNNNQVVNYALTVSCTGTPGNTYYQQPENPYYPPENNYYPGSTLYFLPAETMSVVQGNIQPGQVVTYQVQAQQHQPLALILGSPNGDAVLGVRDPNGNQLLDPATQYTYWQWQLPMTGSYTIQVVGGITSETFTLTTKLGKLYTYPAAGSSITINATTVRGLIKSYAFRLSAGVVMTLSLNVPATTAYLDVYGVQTGSILNASSRATTWTGTMPSTQTYVVEVIPGGTMSPYTLTISNP